MSVVSSVLQVSDVLVLRLAVLLWPDYFPSVFGCMRCDLIACCCVSARAFSKFLRLHALSLRVVVCRPARSPNVVDFIRCDRARVCILRFLRVPAARSAPRALRVGNALGGRCGARGELWS